MRRGRVNKKKVIILSVAILVVLAIVLTTVLVVVNKKKNENQGKDDTARPVKVFVVTFDANGGSAVKNIYVLQGRKLKELPTTTRDGYEFAGWYADNDCTILFDKEQPIEQDLTLYAKWNEVPSPEPEPEPIVNSVVFDCKGGTLLPSQEIESGKTVSLPAEPTKRGYKFDGWWDADYSRSWNFDTDTVGENITLYAKWVEVDTFSKENDVVYFGTYPQSKVEDAEILKGLNDIVATPLRDDSKGWTSYGYNTASDPDRMWFIDVEYDGEKYRGVYFADYRSNDPRSAGTKEKSYQDNNGYYPLATYWFLYEPIKWRVVEENDGHAMLFCDIALDAQSFDYDGGEYSNNYAQSTIREWLNDNFYNAAFSLLQKERVLTTNVDNSAQSTRYAENSYASMNTDDKMFLLSYAEITAYSAKAVENGKYESEKESLMLKVSEYAKSQGCFASQDGYCYWRLRSPDAYKSYHSAYVCQDGALKDVYKVFYSDFGIVPALWINI